MRFKRVSKTADDGADQRWQESQTRCSNAVSAYQTEAQISLGDQRRFRESLKPSVDQKQAENNHITQIKLRKTMGKFRQVAKIRGGQPLAAVIK